MLFVVGDQWNTTDKTRGLQTRFTGVCSSYEPAPAPAPPSPSPSSPPACLLPPQWANIELSARGEEQARAAGRALMQFRLHTFDAVYMSILQRTTKTYDLMAEEFAKYVVPRNTHPYAGMKRDDF